MIKLTPTGALDLTYGGGDGVSTFLAGTAGPCGSAVGSKREAYGRPTLDSSGNLFLNGYSRCTNRYEGVIWKLDSSGTPVAGFGTAGKAVLSSFNTTALLGDPALATKTEPFSGKMVIDTDGSILVAFRSRNEGSRTEPGLVRFTAAGAMDTTFGDGAGYIAFRHNLTGAAGAPVSSKADTYSIAQVDRKGRFVLLGSSVDASGGTFITVSRYLSSGQINE